MYSKNLKIGILGSGIVGRVLANAFLTEGNAVMFGTRDVNKPEIIKWETEDMGKVEAARAIEALCILWCIPGSVGNDWMHAFKLIR